MGSMIKLPALEAFQSAAAFEIVGLSEVIPQKSVEVIYPDTDRQVYRLKWRLSDEDHEAYLGLDNFTAADIAEDGTICIADDNGTPMVLKLYSEVKAAPVSREVSKCSPSVRLYVDLSSREMLITEKFKLDNDIRDFVKRFGTVTEVRFELIKDSEPSSFNHQENRSKFLGENFIPEATNNFAFSVSHNQCRNMVVMDCHFSTECQAEFLRLITESLTRRLAENSDGAEFNFERAMRGFSTMAEAIKDPYSDDIPF